MPQVQRKLQFDVDQHEEYLQKVKLELSELETDDGTLLFNTLLPLIQTNDKVQHFHIMAWLCTLARDGKIMQYVAEYVHRYLTVYIKTFYSS